MAEDLHNNSPWSQRLKDWEASGPGPEPLPGDWDRLAKKIDKRPRRRIAAWLWWRVGLLLVSGIVAALLLYPTNSSQGGADEYVGTKRQLQLNQNEAAINDRPAEAGETPLTTLASPMAASVGRNQQLAAATTIPVERSINRLEEGVTNESTDEPANSTSDLADLTSSQNNAISDESIDQINVEPVDRGISRAIVNSSATKAEVVLPLDRLPIPFLMIPQPGMTINAFYDKPILENSLLVSPSSLGQETPLEEELREPAKLSLAIGPQIGIFRPEVNVELPANTIRAETEAENVAFSYGVGAQIRLGKHWGLQTGIISSMENSTHRFFLARRYDPANEVLDAQGNGVNRIDLEYATSYTKGEAEVELFRSADVSTSEIRFIRLGVILEEEVKTTTIPLLLTYDMPLSKKFGLRIGAGAAWNRQTVSVGIRSRLSALVDMEIRQSNIRASERLLNSEFWTGQLSAGLVYQPFNHWEIVFSPQWFTSLSNLSADQQLNAGYNRFSFSTGINYRF